MAVPILIFYLRSCHLYTLLCALWNDEDSTHARLVYQTTQGDPSVSTRVNIHPH